MSKLKFGILVDQGELPLLLANLIATAARSEHYTIDCLIVQSLPEKPEETVAGKALTVLDPPEFLSRVRSRLFRGITWLERYMLLRREETSVFLETTPVENTGLPCIPVVPEVSSSGHVFRFSKDDLASIQERGLDGLIRGGSGILRGDILTLCRFGVLSFHHGDNNEYRGGPAGFWEVFHREKSTGFIVQRLTDELDGGDVYVKGAVGTEPSYLLNQIKVQRKSMIFMHRLLEEIARSGDYPEPKAPVPYAKTAFKYTPKLTVQLPYLWRYCWRYFMMQVDAVLGRSWRWGVSYQFVDDWRSAVLSRSIEIKNPPNHFLADPFVLFRDGKHYLFVEDYDYATYKGVVTVYEVNSQGYKELGLALEEDFHLSYPFLLEHGGETYMIPESEQKKQIRMYRAVDFPLKWELHRVLMSDIRAADSTVFERDGKWWMFTNVDTAEISDHDSELHIYSADAPDSTEWEAHAGNPVIFDSRYARMGGLLSDADGQLYRVYQKQGQAVYGEAMGIARIDVLNPQDYRETIMVEIEPTFYEGLRGTHTYSHADGLLAIDHLRWQKLSD